MDQADAAEVLGLVRHDVLAGRDVTPERRFPRPDTLLSIYNKVVATATPLSQVVARDFPWCRQEVDAIGPIFEGYTARKRSRRLLDFEDLLLGWRALGATADGAALLAGLWDQVLVDEYQDTNAVQGDILELLRPGGAGLTVVGDDAQSIYAFRAARAGALAAYADHFPGTTVVALEENYRSTPEILAVANAVMAGAPDRVPGVATLWSRRAAGRRPVLRRCQDEAVQAEAVCDSVLRHREDGVALRRQAVLFRTSHHADLLELALARRNIPYVKYGGLRILEAAHVRDLLALLRVLDNPWDEVAWFRVLTLVDGIGAATARQLMAALGFEGCAAGGWAECDVAATPLARLLAAPPAVPSMASAEVAELRRAWADCADGCLPGGATPEPADQIERLCRWLEPVVTRRYRAPAVRVADLAQLGQVAARYPDRGRFLVELTLDPPSATGDLAGPPLLDEDWLVLSTVHSAKGGEWDVVHVLHATDGMFPSDMACGDAEGIAEERRLLYVAVTRARDRLEINAPQRYHVAREQFRRLSDAHVYAPLSRFLSDQVRLLLDEEHAGVPVADAGQASPAGSQGVAMAEVDRFLSGLWA